MTATLKATRQDYRIERLGLFIADVFFIPTGQRINATPLYGEQLSHQIDYDLEQRNSNVSSWWYQKDGAWVR